MISEFVATSAWMKPPPPPALPAPDVCDPNGFASVDAVEPPPNAPCVAPCGAPVWPGCDGFCVPLPPSAPAAPAAKALELDCDDDGVSDDVSPLVIERKVCASFVASAFLR